MLSSASGDAVHASPLGTLLALAAGIPAVDVARFGGTSVTMLERVYHHLLVSSAENARARIDQFVAASASAEGLGVA